MTIWYILQPFGIFFGNFVCCMAILYMYTYMAIWYIYGNFVYLWSFRINFHFFGILYQEKSGNPGFSLLLCAENLRSLCTSLPQYFFLRQFFIFLSFRRFSVWSPGETIVQPCYTNLKPSPP
jgi:hypothetical protein